MIRGRPQGYCEFEGCRANQRTDPWTKGRGKQVMLKELVHIQMPQKPHTQVTWTAFENHPVI